MQIHLGFFFFNVIYEMILVRKEISKHEKGYYSLLKATFSVIRIQSLGGLVLTTFRMYLNTCDIICAIRRKPISRDTSCDIFFFFLILQPTTTGIFAQRIYFYLAYIFPFWINSHINLYSCTSESNVADRCRTKKKERICYKYAT